MKTLYFKKDNIYLLSFFESYYKDFFHWLEETGLLPISLKGTRENNIKDFEELFKFLKYDLNILMVSTEEGYLDFQNIYKYLGGDPLLSVYVIG